jgi:hypothetical protein
VGPALVVVVEPVWQRSSAVLGGAVADAVSPLACQRLVEALDFAVGARPIRLRGEVLDAAGGEQLAEAAAVCVAPGVVGHQPPRADPVRLEDSECSLGEGDHGSGAFVGQQLGVSEPGVVSTSACA